MIYENWWRARSFNWVHVWQESCINCAPISFIISVQKTTCTCSLNYRLWIIYFNRDSSKISTVSIGTFLLFKFWQWNHNVNNSQKGLRYFSPPVYCCHVWWIRNWLQLHWTQPSLISTCLVLCFADTKTLTIFSVKMHSTQPCLIGNGLVFYSARTETFFQWNYTELSLGWQLLIAYFIWHALKRTIFF